MERSLPPEQDVRKIACLMINGIGDILVVTPVFQALKDRYPNARITVLIRPHLKGLLEGNPYVDDLIFYDTQDAQWRRIIFMWQIFRRGFDLWVDLHVPTFNTVSSNERDFLRNSLLMRISRARYRIGYAVPQLAPHLTHPLPVPDADKLTTVNIVDTTLALVAPKQGKRYNKFMPVTAADREWAEVALPGSTALRVGLFFGSRQSADIWPDESIEQFTRLLCQHFPDVELVLIGNEHERRLTDKLLDVLPQFSNNNVHNSVCQASLEQTAETQSSLRR